MFVEILEDISSFRHSARDTARMIFHHRPHMLRYDFPHGICLLLCSSLYLLLLNSMKNLTLDGREAVLLFRWAAVL